MSRIMKAVLAANTLLFFAFWALHMWVFSFPDPMYPHHEGLQLSVFVFMATVLFLMIAFAPWSSTLREDFDNAGRY